MNTPQVLQLIYDERRRQDAKWGEQNHNQYYWMTVLGEEFGEACKATFEDDPAEYVGELVQVAAVAVCAIESLYRQIQKAPHTPEYRRPLTPPYPALQSARTALSNVAAALRASGQPGYTREFTATPDWNPDAHLDDIMMTIADVRSVHNALDEVKDALGETDA